MKTTDDHAAIPVVHGPVIVRQCQDQSACGCLEEQVMMSKDTIACGFTSKRCEAVEKPQSHSHHSVTYLLHASRTTIAFLHHIQDQQPVSIGAWPRCLQPCIVAVATVVERNRSRK